MGSRLKNAAVGLTVTGSLAVGIVGGFEGLRTLAYRDVVGVPTVCFGETRGVEMGDQYTIDQCRSMLGAALIEFETGMRKCMRMPDVVPDKSYVAFLSFTYNVGVANFCKSTLSKKLNTGDLRGACNELPKWNTAGGRIVKGLVNRRAEERALCLEGLR